MMSEARNLQSLQVIFGAVLMIFGMLMITPMFMYSGNTVILFIAIALLCFKDGLILLTSALRNLTKKE